MKDLGVRSTLRVALVFIASSCGGVTAPQANSAQAEAMRVDATPVDTLSPSESATTDQPKPMSSSRPTIEAPSSAGKSETQRAGLSSEMESFASGLIVDVGLVGGPAPGPELPKGTRVLHVGDSFAGALGMELDRLLKAAGVNSRIKFETSTYIPTWAHSAKLASQVSKFKPDLVLISLGANELEIPEPEKRATLVKKLVGSLGDTPCVWIAPVLWDGANPRLLEVIRDNVGPCVYLDSNRLIKAMPRAGDKIHPSMAARPDWATVTARWLAYHRRPNERQPWALARTP